MVADLSFSEVSSTSIYLSSFLGVCCIQTAGSVASSVLSPSRSRLTPGVPLHCFGRLVMYTGFAEMKEWREDPAAA